MKERGRDAKVYDYYSSVDLYFHIHSRSVHLHVLAWNHCSRYFDQDGPSDIAHSFDGGVHILHDRSDIGGNMDRSRSFYDNGGHAYKKNAIKTAIELGYSQDVIDKIEKAKTDQQISTIMYLEALKIGEE